MIGGIAIVLKTTNGGVNWTLNSLGLGGFDFINSVSYNDLLNAVILLEADRIYKTTDGGLSWVSHTLNLSSYSECCDIARYQSFANVNTGFLVSDFGTIIKTTIGGVTFITQSNSNVINDFHYLKITPTLSTL